MVAPIGPLAIISCELRQARKGATVAVTLCAGVWLIGVATQFLFAKSQLVPTLTFRRRFKGFGVGIGVFVVRFAPLIVIVMHLTHVRYKTLTVIGR